MILLKARTAAARELEYTIFNSASVGKELRSTRLFTRNANIMAKGIRTKVGFTFKRIPRVIPSNAECPSASLKKESCRSTAKEPISPPKEPVKKPPINAR